MPTTAHTCAAASLSAPRFNMASFVDVRERPRHRKTAVTAAEKSSRRRVFCQRVSVHDERAQMLGARRMTQLDEGLGLYLADAFARQLEMLADFFQRVLGLHVDAEAHPQNLRFALGKAVEQL